MKKQLLPLLLTLVLATACNHAVVAPIPGSANAFDSNTYLTLVATDSVIQSTKTDLAGGVFAASIGGNVKTALNDLITAYDAADTAYLAYHSAAMAGNATTSQQTAVQTLLNNVSSATINLATAKVAKQ